MIGNVDQYAWSWGESGRARLVREAIELRYRLLPYIYAAFCARPRPASRSSGRWCSTTRTTRRETDDQYLFGRDLLVAPVIEPGTTSRQVYLPGDWYDWYRASVSGWVIAPTPMDRIPLYVRAGAVIPMWPEAPPSTDGYHPSSVELHVFPGDGESILHEDDGLTFSGGFLRTTFTLSGRAAPEVSGDGYPEFARERKTPTMPAAPPPAVSASTIAAGCRCTVRLIRIGYSRCPSTCSMTMIAASTMTAATAPCETSAISTAAKPAETRRSTG